MWLFMLLGTARTRSLQNARDTNQLASNKQPQQLQQQKSAAAAAAAGRQAGRQAGEQQQHHHTGSNSEAQFDCTLKNEDRTSIIHCC